MTHLTNGQLEFTKLAFNLLFVLVTVGVWLGVYLENDKFSELTKRIGWRLLVYSLAAETLFGILLWQTDSEISRRQKVEIIALETKIAPRRLSLEQQKMIAEMLVPYAGRKVRVATYAGDAEGSSLGEQIVASLHGARIDVESALASVMPLGGFGAGVFVSGSDKELRDAISKTLETKGGLVMNLGTGFFRGNISSSAPTTVPPAQILVGVKPVETIETFKE